MASDSTSSGFHHHHHHQPPQQQQQGGALFKPDGGAAVGGGVLGGCELMNFYRSSGGSLNLAGNDGGRRGVIGGAQNSMDCASPAGMMDAVPAGLKHEAGFAAEWSMDEQYKLEEGLAKYANEPNIMRYIKIAASLRDKSVRDVALRCRWLTRKRRKQEDHSLGKKVKDPKEKIELSLKNDLSPTSSVNMALYSSTSNLHNQSGCMLSGVLNGKARHLLEENHQAFGQISVNLSTLKLQQNIDLFFRTRNNLTTILNDMRNMPGVMSQMPPLPVLLNEELASTIFPRSSQPMMFSSSGVKPMKQEPGC